MEFSVSREQLLEKAQTAAAVVERKQTMAILANVLIEVDATGAVVTGTDLDTEISTSMELVEVASGGSVTVPGRKLVDIAKALPEGSVVQFKQDGNQMSLSSGRSRFKLATLPQADYPRLKYGRFDGCGASQGPVAGCDWEDAVCDGTTGRALLSQRHVVLYRRWRVSYCRNRRAQIEFNINSVGRYVV